MSKVVPEKYYYLASPYSHSDFKIQEQREVEVSKLGARLTKLGLNLYCPITQSHRLNDFLFATNTDVLSHDECMRVDYAFLSRAKGLIVVMLDGWKESQGVGLEIDYAKEQNMPIYYLSPTGNLEDFVKAVKNPRERKEEMLIASLNNTEQAVEDYYKEKDASIARIDPKYMQPPTGTISHWKGASKEDVDDNFFEGGDAALENLKKQEKTFKGASKEGKPSIMNFPWLAFEDTECTVMNDLIKAYLDKNEKKLKVELCAFYSKLDNAPVGSMLLNVLPIFEQGQKKHRLRSHLNYTKDDIELLLNALGRHILKGIENVDEESGFTHRQHAIANVLLLLQILNKRDSNG